VVPQDLRLCHHLALRAIGVVRRQAFQAGGFGEIAPIVILVEQLPPVDRAAASRKPQDRSGWRVAVVCLVIRRPDRNRYGHRGRMLRPVRRLHPASLHRSGWRQDSTRPDAAMIGLICDLHPSYAFIHVPGDESRALLYFHRRADYQGLMPWDRLLSGDRVEFVEELPTPRHGRRARQVKALPRSVWDASMKERTP
jgi:hypothetical protein